MLKVGIDIGGTKIHVGIFDKETKRLLAEQKSYVADVTDVSAHIKETLMQLCHANGIDAKEIVSCGIGIPGTVSADGRKIVKAPNIRLLSDSMVEELEQVVTQEETAQLQKEFHKVAVCDDVAGFIMDIISATRDTRELVSGVSTRGAIALYKAAQVTAAMAGRDYVIPEDVVQEAIPVLAHRICAASGSRADAENYLRRQMARCPVPLEKIDTV
jgi:hypothetical protein